jgi:hypothetical protein
MHFSPNKRQVSDPESNHLTIDGIPLKQVSETKFLGVTIDDGYPISNNWLKNCTVFVAAFIASKAVFLNVFISKFTTLSLNLTSVTVLLYGEVYH